VNPRATTQRSRLTEAEREVRRLSDAIAQTLGRDIRSTRRRMDLTQADLAIRVGVHQTWISDIELGRGQGVPLDLWIAIGMTIGRPFAASLTRSVDPDALRDAGHLEMQEQLLMFNASTGRRAVVERPSSANDPRHSTDVAFVDDAARVLILVEAWNTFGDIGAAIRSTHRKQTETLATAEDGYRVASVWVVRASAANRAIIARYPNLFAATFDGSSRDCVRALTDGSAPPERPGLVWYDPSRRRLTAWRRPAPTSPDAPR
jgi:transcriptional regulator with XRE-family HTH domain